MTLQKFWSCLLIGVTALFLGYLSLLGVWIVVSLFLHDPLWAEPFVAKLHLGFRIIAALAVGVIVLLVFGYAKEAKANGYHHDLDPRQLDRDGGC